MFIKQIIMKIKTITCHDVYNAGASLQAYALMTYLQKLGHEVQIINYKPDYLSNHYNLWTISNPKYEKNVILKYLYLIIKFPKRFIDRQSKKKKLFDEFTKKHLNTTNEIYHSNEELKKSPPDADIYIAGSDQIWNSFFKNGRDPAFYLDFVPINKIKASYAASFATNKIVDKYKWQIIKWIQMIDYVGIRETSGVKLAKSMGITKAVQVLDPVFLLEKEEWEKLIKESCIKKNKDSYLIVYDFDDNEDIKEICIEIAKKLNLKIFSFFSNNYADKVISNYGPIEFLSIIKNSSFVISNSFHGTAFSIIFEKPFFVINRKENLNSRMIDLLSMLDLEDRMISRLEDYKQYSFKINVNKKLEKQINNSKQYISDILKKQH